MVERLRTWCVLPHKAGLQPLGSIEVMRTSWDAVVIILDRALDCTLDVGVYIRLVVELPRRLEVRGLSGRCKERRRRWSRRTFVAGIAIVDG